MPEELQEKTEFPTKKRLKDLREKGKVPKSKDIVIATLLLINMLVMLFFSPAMYKRFTVMTVYLFNNLLFDYQDMNTMTYWFRLGLGEIALILLPMLIFVLFGAILINFVQTGFILSVYPIMPKWKNLNVFNLENYKKYYSFRTILRIMLGQTRFITVTIASWFIVSGDMNNIYRMTNASSHQILHYIFKRAMLVGIFLSCAFLCIGVIDFIYQNWRFIKENMMSKKEVADEKKQTEGDSGRRKRALITQRKNIYKQAHHQIPHSTAVITDPSFHYAVAIRYDPKLMTSPLCTCKGKADRAGALIKIAKEFQIPIVENGKIAKVLFRDLEPKENVKAQNYKMVAEVLTKIKGQKVYAVDSP